jgi:hypothetical protein
MARRHHWNYLRYPRTAQELRAGATRAKRAHLPTAWDDIARRPQRCWKEQRRIKWRRIAEG